MGDRHQQPDRQPVLHDSPPPPAVLPAALRPFVRSVAGYCTSGLPPSVHRGLPGCTLTLVLALEAPIGMADSASAYAAGRVAQHAAVLGGLHLEPVFVVQPSRWRGIQIDLRPLGARRLLGAPASALPLTGAGGAADLLGAHFARMQDRLSRVTSWEGRYLVVLNWLCDQVGRTQPGGVRPEVVEMWRLLETQHGRTTVAQLADHVGLGRRRLAQVFTAEFGVTPKVAARLIRFDAVRHAITAAAGRAGSLDLTGIAVRHGFFDHAHLDREFAAFAGLSPTGWLAAEVPFIQVGTPPGRPGS